MVCNKIGTPMLQYIELNNAMVKRNYGASTFSKKNRSEACVRVCMYVTCYRLVRHITTDFILKDGGLFKVRHCRPDYDKLVNKNKGSA